jgi:Tol biopolymer transport system component
MRRSTRLCCWTTFLVVLALAWAAAAEAAFPGANGKLCFSRHLGGDNTEIFVMNADGSDQTRLTFTSTEDLNCAWSHDGSQIAFQTNRDGDHEVYVMNADGSSQTNLSNDSAFDGAPTWSPDGAKIAFQSNRDGDDEVFVMNADGSNQVQITANVATDGGPSWSPDGTKIAFSSGGIKVMDPDGTNQTPLTTGASDSQPDWSPDGAKIAFDSPQDGDFEIYAMNADGSGQTQLTLNLVVVDGGPAWSPDGTKIAFYTDRDNEPGLTEIYAMNAGGSSPTNLSNADPTIDGGPNWQPLDTTPPDPPTLTDTDPDSPANDDSPEVKGSAEAGSTVRLYTTSGCTGPEAATGPAADFLSPGLTVSVAENSTTTLYATATDAAANVSSCSSSSITYVEVSGYPRPKGASPLRVPLVPAYVECTAPNAVHGPPPLGDEPEDPSCEPPVQSSDWLTVGTPDTNGAAANSIGFARLGVIVGDPGPPDDSDVSITASMSDVRCKVGTVACGTVNSGDGPDYTGEVHVTASIRLTDRFNAVSAGGGTDPATVADFPLPVTTPCASTPSDATGSSCAITTSGNALAPGAVRDGKRAIVELSQVQVFDGGTDGVQSTSPNTLFAVQGIFIP